jgi:hypothetical protein
LKTLGNYTSYPTKGVFCRFSGKVVHCADVSG